MTFNEIICRVASEAILPGVSSILSFIPSIAFLIAILTLFKEMGIVRGERVLYLMGFSCSVPAILASCDIPDKRRRYLTMLTIPFMSCSAKLPIYVMLSSIFFPAYPITAVISIYLVGIFTAALISLPVKGAQNSLPRVPIQRPRLRPILDAVKDATFGFVRKAFTVILISSVIIWFLQNLDSSMRFTSVIEESLLAHIGLCFEPVFEPLGFGDRRAIAALIAGITSKESVVSTFAVMAGSSDNQALSMMLRDIFTPASAFSFMVFCLLYTPCISTLIAARNVTESILVPILIFIGQTGLAWCLSFLIFYSIKVII